MSLIGGLELDEGGLAAIAEFPGGIGIDGLVFLTWAGFAMGKLSKLEGVEANGSGRGDGVRHRSSKVSFPSSSKS